MGSARAIGEATGHGESASGGFVTITHACELYPLKPSNIFGSTHSDPFLPQPVLTTIVTWNHLFTNIIIFSLSHKHLFEQPAWFEKNGGTLRRGTLVVVGGAFACPCKKMERLECEMSDGAIADPRRGAIIMVGFGSLGGGGMLRLMRPDTGDM